MTLSIGDKSPRILAFDTSSAHCDAAVLCGNEVMCHINEPMHKGQAERLMGLLGDVLENSDLGYQDLQAIGVGVGPGNFTGIRIAVSAARGLAYALKIPAVGVSNLEALREGFNAPCATTIDARREHYYFQNFTTDDTPQQATLVSAGELPAYDGPLIGALGQAPALPVSEAIARIAARRYTQPLSAPAPLYLRPADAAPARDAPPTVFP